MRRARLQWPVRIFRAGAEGRGGKWVKESTIVLCGSLLPLSLVLGWGPGNDKSQAKELITKLYADTGYDTEWFYDRCLLEWGAESVIKPAKQRADATRSGFWRSRMSEGYLARKGYGSRWAVESFFSALKRKMGLTLPHANQANCWSKPPSRCRLTPSAVSQTDAVMNVFNRAAYNHFTPINAVVFEKLASLASELELPRSVIKIRGFEILQICAISARHLTAQSNFRCNSYTSGRSSPFKF